MDPSDFGSDSKSPYTGDQKNLHEAPSCAEACGSSPKEEDPRRNYNKEQWAVLGSGTYRAVGKSLAKLPPAMYSLDSDNAGNLFVKKPIEVDSLLRFPNSVADDILSEIDTFWGEECTKAFAYYGYLHRRGYLLYGPQGGGKTCACQLIIADIIKRGGLVILANGSPAHTSSCLLEFREIEPDRPIVCLFEEMEAIISRHGEADILSLLDGENQISRVINISTTNFPELLPQRIISRPRRFDRVIKLGFPPASHRQIYFTHKLKIKENEVEAWVKATDGFSFAACAELVISVKCLGNDFDETIEVLSKLSRGKASSEEFSSSAGFSNGNRSEGKQMTAPGHTKR
jgi:hypothetical protein